jgi:hypothetical protein
VETAREAGLNPDATDDPALRLLYRNLASGAESGALAASPQLRSAA